jgi:hypothetical protein
MTDKPKDNVKAIRSGIAIKPVEDEEEKLQPNPSVVEQLTILLEEANKGEIQEIAFAACGKINKFGIFGYHPNRAQMGYEIRGIQILHEEEAYSGLYESLYDIGEFDFDE